MIIQPLIRNNVCLNAHPVGCREEVCRQIEYAKTKGPLRGGPHTALVLGCSTGFGLASRVLAAFPCGANTVGVSLERPADETRSASPGWYANRAFDHFAQSEGRQSVTIDGDAFADETKHRTIDALRAMGRGVDLVVYSLASPVRTDPVEGVTYRSSIKPLDKPYEGAAVNMMTGRITPMVVEPATREEVRATVKVMGGEDWKRWMHFLTKAGLLNPGCRTVAYSYIGPAVSHPIYRGGTLGMAKEHLEKTARDLHDHLRRSGGGAWVSVNKALVTRASAVIPVIPLYIACLFKVMKAKGLHEGCVEQIDRLFRERLYTGAEVPVDEVGRIRIDDWEMRADVQAEVADRMAKVNAKNLAEMTDYEGYRADFMAAHGFGLPSVDYNADVDPTRVF